MTYTFEQKKRALRHAISCLKSKIALVEKREKKLRRFAEHHQHRQRLSIRRRQTQYKFLHELRLSTAAGTHCVFQLYIEKLNSEFRECVRELTDLQVEEARRLLRESFHSNTCRPSGPLTEDRLTGETRHQ